jgi:uncharacterized membrane protein
MDRKAGLICAGLAAGLPYLTAYGQETRMYSLLTLLALIAAASFVHVFVRHRRAYLPVFSLSLTAALYTHAWALFLAAMTGAAFLVCVREAGTAERRVLLRDGLIAFGIIAVLFAPWVPTLLYQARHTGAPWALAPVAWSVTQGLYAIAGGRGAAVALLFGGGAGLLALLRIRNGPLRLQLTTKVLLILGLGTLLVAFVYAKSTPAWTLRYLAVIVGPLLILFGLALARGGRLALVAVTLVATFWVLDPVPTKRYWKSNVADTVAALRPYLGRDPLIISTQPENTPTVHYYVNAPATYGSLLGLNRDPRMLDWRDALERLRRASVSRTLVPMLDTVAVGQRVVLVSTVNLANKPLWMKLINRDTKRWSAYLKHDHRFRRLLTKAPHQYGAGIVSVSATVFERVR